MGRKRTRTDARQIQLLLLSYLAKEKKKSSYFLSRSGSAPTVHDFHRSFHPTGHKIIFVNNPCSVRRISLCGLFQILRVAHGSDFAFVSVNCPNAFHLQTSSLVSAFILYQTTSSWFTRNTEPIANPIYRIQSTDCNWREVLRRYLWGFLVVDMALLVLPV